LPGLKPRLRFLSSASGMTLGTKVGWGLEADLLWLKQAVFLGWWGSSVSRAKAEATVFVLSVRNDAGHQSGLGA
jgi:hypothetical protein